MTHADRRTRRKKIAGEMAAGKRLGEVCAMFGVSERQVYLACKEFKVSTPGRGGKTLEIYARLRKARRTPGRVARDLEVSPERVYQVLREARRLKLPLAARR
jgi:DNA-binding CsgD family transcriptional regulator